MRSFMLLINVMEKFLEMLKTIKILKVIFLNVIVIIMVTKSMTHDDNVDKDCVTLVKKTIFM